MTNSEKEKYLECTVGGIAYDMGEDESTRFEVYLEMENGIHGVNTTPRPTGIKTWKDSNASAHVPVRTASPANATASTIVRY